MDNNKQDLEPKIIETARECFINHGYAETSMSEIAAEMRISRTTLHYYFRTKDKLFEAVIGSIVSSIAPYVTNIITQESLTIKERIKRVVDIYYIVFKKYPRLPMFLYSELSRDPAHMFDVMDREGVYTYFRSLVVSMNKLMEYHFIHNVALRELALTFYSMLATPFVANPICHEMLGEDETYEQFLESWKETISTTINAQLLGFRAFY